MPTRTAIFRLMRPDVGTNPLSRYNLETGNNPMKAPNCLFSLMRPATTHNQSATGIIPTSSTDIFYITLCSCWCQSFRTLKPLIFCGSSCFSWPSEIVRRIDFFLISRSPMPNTPLVHKAVEMRQNGLNSLVDRYAKDQVPIRLFVK